MRDRKGPAPAGPLRLPTRPRAAVDRRLRRVRRDPGVVLGDRSCDVAVRAAAHSSARAMLRTRSNLAPRGSSRRTSRGAARPPGRAARRRRAGESIALPWRTRSPSPRTPVRRRRRDPRAQRGCSRSPPPAPAAEACARGCCAGTRARAPGFRPSTAGPRRRRVGEVPLALTLRAPRTSSGQQRERGRASLPPLARGSKPRQAQRQSLTRTRSVCPRTMGEPGETEWPREESNLRTWIRSPPLYPLSYGAARRGEGWSMGLEPTTTGTTTRGSTN